MNAQVSFLDGTLSLIHIPLDLYSNLLQSILKVLLPPSQHPARLNTAEGLSVESYSHAFLNISVTPIECSIVCNSAWAESVFEPAIKRLPKDQAKAVAISKDTYAALSVYGTGMDAGSRVADLTSPLALANIPIFFITTYYSDFILVPVKDRKAVERALLAKGFVFSEDDASRLVSAQPSPTGTNQRFDFGHSRAPSQENNNNNNNNSSSSSSSNNNDPPGPPAPPSSVNDLQQRTIDLLKRRHVVPYVEPGLTLAQCTGIRHPDPQQPSSVMTATFSRGNGSSCGGGSNRGSNSRRGSRPARPGWIDTVDARLYTALVAALASRPRFLSLTLAHEDPPSLLLDRELLALFGDSLVGPTDGALVPIFLDLADLPFEATGIVSGVAGKLVKSMRIADGAELSYLSTARAGAVILSREQADVALGVLGPLLSKE